MKKTKEQKRLDKYREKQREKRKYIIDESIEMGETVIDYGPEEYNEIKVAEKDDFKQQYMQRPYYKYIEKEISLIASNLYEDINKVYRFDVTNKTNRTMNELATLIEFDFAYCCGQNTSDRIADKLKEEVPNIGLYVYELSATIPVISEIPEESFEVKQIDFSLRDILAYLREIRYKFNMRWDEVIYIYRKIAKKEYLLSMERADRFKENKGLNKSDSDRYRPGGDKLKYPADFKIMVSTQTRENKNKYEKVLTKNMIEKAMKNIQQKSNAAMIKDMENALIGMAKTGLSASNSGKAMRYAIDSLSAASTNIVVNNIETSKENKEQRFKTAKPIKERKRAIDL